MIKCEGKTIKVEQDIYDRDYVEIRISNREYSECVTLDKINAKKLAYEIIDSLLED